MNFGVFGRFYLAVATFIAGDAEQAERHVDDACELAAGLDQPHTLCFSMAARCTLALLREDARSPSEAGARCAEFAGRMGFLEFVGLARIVSGWAIGRSGSLIEGLAELDEGVRLWKATGFENWQAYFGLLRAEILERLGRRTHALHELAVHLARIESSGELLFQSLLLALRASILARGSPDAGASAQLFEAAAGVAKRQAALAWSRRIDKMDAACAVHKASAFAPHP
jgi:predicted ATPase